MYAKRINVSNLSILYFMVGRGRIPFDGGKKLVPPLLVL